MTIFPVITSTIAPAHIAAFVKDRYQVQTAVNASILKTGISHTYLVTAADQQYVFRVYSYQWRTEKEIAEEIRLLLLLTENKLPVSYPIADGQSNYIQHLQAPEGMRFGVLFSFAAGEKLLNFSAELHYQAGTMMAKMHAVTHHLQLERVSYTPQVLLINSFDQLQQFLPVTTTEMIFMQAAREYLYELYGNADTAVLRRGIVHLDIWFDNMSIHNNAGITLFDFDFCGNGWLLLDIAYYILQLYSTEKDEKEFILKKDSFLQGYESVTPISAEEKRLLPASGISLYLFYLGVQCSRYDNWSNVFLNELYLKRYINLLVKKWAQYNQLPIAG